MNKTHLALLSLCCAGSLGAAGCDRSGSPTPGNPSTVAPPGAPDAASSADAATGAGTSCATGASAPVSSDEEVVAAARAAAAFRGSLDAMQLAQASYCLEDTELFSWSNLPPNLAPREGLPLSSLSPAQLALAYAMLDAFLSTSGYDRMFLITNTLDPALLAQTHQADMFGTGLYRLSLFNDPGHDGAWGVQIDGHHCAITFVVDGDHVSMTPAFFGSDPRVYQNLRTFDAEETAAFDFVASLSARELSAAIVANQAPGEVVTAPGNTGVDAARDYDFTSFAASGLRYSAMSAAARHELRVLIAKALAYQADPWFTTKMAMVDAALASSTFVWMGPPTSTVAGNGERFYFRVYNPAVLIEFDLTSGSNHAHLVIRSPDHEDYGSFAFHVPTLLEHYRQVPHDRGESAELGAEPDAPRDALAGRLLAVVRARYARPH